MFAYHSALKTGFKSGLINGTDPFSYAASHKNDSDHSSWDESMNVNESEYYIAYAKKAISQLTKQKICK